MVSYHLDNNVDFGPAIKISSIFKGIFDEGHHDQGSYSLFVKITFDFQMDFFTIGEPEFL